MIWIILALLFSVAMTVVTLIRLYRYKARWLSVKEELRQTQEKRVIPLRAQLDECMTQRDALKLKLDEALRPKVPAVDGAVKKPRVSRAKPPLAE